MALSAREKLAKTAAAAVPERPSTTVVAKELGWLPDCVLTGEKFESGLAFFADATGRITRFSREPADLAVAKRLAGQAALPGMINTHSQSWQRVLRGRFELRARADRETLGNWNERFAHAQNRLSDEDIYDASRMAFLEMLHSGITCVGEAQYLHRGPDAAPWAEPHAGARAILRAAHDVGVRISLLHGAWCRTDFGQPAGSGPSRCVTPTSEQFVREAEGLRDFIEKNYPGDEAWIGVAVRGLGAVPSDMLKAIAAYAHAKRLRLHLSLGESAGEAVACATEYGRSPAALLAEHGVLDKRFVAVHGAHLSDEDIRILGTARVTVCACPAADLHLGEGAVSVDRLLAAGASIALGTNGPLQANLLDHVRALEFQIRSRGQRAALGRGEVAAALWQAATTVGARSLGATGGSLEIGRPADFFTVNLYDPSLVGAAPENLLGAILFGGSPRAVREVWVGARQRVAQWRHAAASGIIDRFAELQARLWAE